MKLNILFITLVTTIFVKESYSSSDTKFPQIKPSKRGSSSIAGSGDVSATTATTSSITSNLVIAVDDESIVAETNTLPSYNQAQQQQSKKSKISKAFANLPSVFGIPASSKYQPAVVINDVKTNEIPPRKTHFMVLDILNPILGGSKSNDHAQLKQATEKLLNYMKSNDDSMDNQKDKSILDILAAFPRHNVPIEAILKTLTKIWGKVRNYNHLLIFEEVSAWAVALCERDFPSEYWNLLDHVITNDFHYSVYQQAIKKAASLLSKQQVQFIVGRLLHHLLDLKEDGEYEFYGKFNIHFMELVMNYPNFHELDFIKNFELPAPLILTPILKLIYKSTEILSIFRKSGIFDPADVGRLFSSLSEICIETELSPIYLAEQIQIILKLNQDSFEHFYSSEKIVFMNIIAETLENLIAVNQLYPQIPGKTVYALAVQGNFDQLLLLMIKHLNPIFSVKEFGFLLNLADRLSLKDPFGVLLTLLGSITIPRAAWSCSDAFQERSLRLHMYIETILSIQDQNLSYNEDNDTLCINIRALGKSRAIEWKIPRAIDKDSYELITTRDMLVIPLLFIQRVLHRDYRNSRVIDKYSRAGKPNYLQFPKIINEILEDQCYGIDYKYPIVEIIAKFPKITQRLDAIV